MGSKKPGKNQATAHGQGEPNIQPQNADSRIQPCAAPPELPLANTHYDATCHAENDWWNKHKKWAEIIGLLVLVIYTAYTVKMYYANRDAADAAKSSADTASKNLADFEAVEAAQVAVEFAPTVKTGKPGEGLIVRGNIDITNIGQTTAVNFTAMGYLWIRNLNPPPKGGPPGLALSSHIRM